MAEEKKRPVGRPKGSGKGRTWSSQPPGKKAIRCNVDVETAVDFRRLASTLATSSADLVSRLVAAAVEAGADGAISLKKLKVAIDADYQRRKAGSGD